MSKLAKETKTEKTYVPATFVTKMIDKVGAAELAELLDYSTSYLYTAKRDNAIATAYETAARYHWEKTAKAEEGRCAILHAPAHVLKTVEDLVKALGGKFHLVP